jgi:hypothetical protein
LDRTPIFEWAHLTRLELAGTHAYDRCPFAIGRLPAQQDDIETVPLLAIMLARRLFAHDALFSVAQVES